MIPNELKKFFTDRFTEEDRKMVADNIVTEDEMIESSVGPQRGDIVILCMNNKERWTGTYLGVIERAGVQMISLIKTGEVRRMIYIYPNDMQAIIIMKRNQTELIRQLHNIKEAWIQAEQNSGQGQ